MKKQYTLVFVFDPKLNSVALIRKRRPDWQRGHLNGIGGHKEEGESFADCARRELREESGVPCFCMSAYWAPVSSGATTFE